MKSVNEQDSEDEVYHTCALTPDADDTQLVTIKLESGNYLRFQVDTGAQCNVVPVELYKKAANDPELKRVTPSSAKIVAYGGTNITVVGRITLVVHRGKAKYRINCKLVEGGHMRPLLGRKACLRMNIVSYLDNEAMREELECLQSVRIMNLSRRNS